MDKREIRKCLFLTIIAVVTNVATMILHLYKGRLLLPVLHLVLIVVVIWSFVGAWRTHKECQQLYERYQSILNEGEKV